MLSSWYYLIQQTDNATLAGKETGVRPTVSLEPTLQMLWLPKLSKAVKLTSK